MSFPVTDPFICLPTEIACSILTKWLHLKELVRVDSAYCNTATRQHILATFNSSFLIIKTRPSYNLKSSYRGWLMSRFIRVSKLLLSGLEDVQKFDTYTQQCRFHILDLSVYKYRDEFQHVCDAVKRNCCNLQSLTFDACCLDSSILNVLSACTQLQSLQLFNCDDQSRSLVTDQSCSTIEQIKSVEIREHNTGALTQRLLELCTRIQRMKISACQYHSGTFTMQPNSTLLTTLCLSKLSDLRDEHVFNICAACPNIQHLDVTHNHSLTDESGATIANLAQLQTLNIIRCAFTDVTMVSLCERRYTLEVLCMSYCARITSFGTERVLRSCIKLHTLHCNDRHVSTQANAPLLRNITSLVLINMDGFDFEELLNNVSKHCKGLQRLSVMFLKRPHFRAFDFTVFNMERHPQLHLFAVCIVGNNKIDIRESASLITLFAERPHLLVLNNRDHLNYEIF